ncbi:hypothetical protein ACHAWF_004808 [Thalassiosira exigua]
MGGNMDRFVSTDWPRKDHASSISASTYSGSTSTSHQPTLEEQHQMLTDQIIKLKFSIAEQKAKRDELRLDWQKLHNEQTDIQEDILDLDNESDDIQANINEANEEMEKYKRRLDQLAMEQAPEQLLADEVKSEYEEAQAELRGAQAEMDRVRTSGESLRATIEGLKANSSEISLEKVKLAEGGDTAEREIGELKAEIAKMQQSVQEAKSHAEEYQEELKAVSNESEKVAKLNEALESKISIREERVTK